MADIKDLIAMRAIRRKTAALALFTTFSPFRSFSSTARTFYRAVPWVRGAKSFRVISYSLVAVAAVMPALVWNSLTLPGDGWRESGLTVQATVIMVGGIILLEAALILWVKMLQFGNERVHRRARSTPQHAARAPRHNSFLDEVSREDIFEAGSKASGRPRVLVVDDDPINRMILRKQLLRLDVDSVSAADGLEALETVRSGRWDLVLMDGSMPRLDGPEAALEIRLGELLPPDVPIVGISTDDTPQFREQCLKAGMQACYHKPVRRFVIEKLVDVYIHHSVAEPPEPILQRALSDEPRMPG